MDDADFAQRYESMDRAVALANRQRRPGPGAPTVDGVPVCRECGDPIPPARLLAVPGCGLCRDCQAEAEQS